MKTIHTPPFSHVSPLQPTGWQTMQAGASGAKSVRIEATDKMADILMSNEKLLLIIERFGIPLGVGNKTVKDICTKFGLHLPLVLTMMNLFNNQDFVIDNQLTFDMLPGLLEYLKRAHHFYLKEKLPYINELLEKFIQNTDNPDSRMIQEFFNEYANEVKEHIELEDDIVFPYIFELHKSFNRKAITHDHLKYSIKDFTEHHSDIEEKLQDLTSLLIKHFPPTKDHFYRNLILIELFGLQYDLNDHGSIEDKILVPLAKNLELTLAKNG